MKNYFNIVKTFLQDLEYPIHFENESEGIFIINNETEGLKNLIIVVTDSILIVEQYLISLPNASANVYKNLLIKNRDIVHGALVLDEAGEKVIFRDTLQISHIDKNEIEGTINSLILLLSEYSGELIKFSKL
ncbi:MAG: hypothetical protein ACPG4Y_08310 [Chitinophagales bacterium]